PMRPAVRLDKGCRLLLAMVLALAGGTAQAVGLVAAYAFSEGSGTAVTDLSGNGNHGTIVGTASWNAQGLFGGALAFNGNTLVQVPASASLNLTTAMTLEAWVNPSVTPTWWWDVIYKGDDNYFLMASSNADTPALGGTWPSGDDFTTAPSGLIPGVWTHLAGTYDGSVARLYVNGVQVSTLPVSGALTSSSNPLQIGGDSFFGQFFNGLIDEVRVYNRALSQAEIRTDMTTPLVPPSGDTIAPSTPGNLAASAVGAGHINLSWIASSDNVGVQKYFVERCQGAGCTDFAYVAIAGGTAFSDGDVATSSSYSYRVRAADAQGNLSPYSNTASAATSEPSTPGLVAAYAFNEGSGTTVSDASGNGNDGAIVGTAGWASQGVFGGALGFDGATLVQVPVARILNLTTAMTLQAWVRPSATGLWRHVIYKGNDNYFLAGSSNTNTPAAGGTWAGDSQYVSAPAELSLNTWTHLAASYDGSAVRLYVNGAQVASFAVSGALVSSSYPLQIGG